MPSHQKRRDPLPVGYQFGDAGRDTIQQVGKSFDHGPVWTNLSRHGTVWTNLSPEVLAALERYFPERRVLKRM